ncbi:MAG: hypothetical protein QXX35_02470 [Desulfurococcaceae archaeon]
MVRVAGLDPSGSEKRYSGLAIINDNQILFINRLKYDSDIVNVVLTYKPIVIAIDSPLSHAEIYREVDLLMKKLNYRVLPPGWNSMRKLVERSIRFKQVFEKNDIVVIETHPYSALKSSRCRDIDELLKIHNIVLNKTLSRDEYDALISALVAKYYVENRVFRVEARDGVIYLLPKIC